MIKNIEINGYNRVTIKKRYETGDCLCDVELIVLDKDEEEVIETADTDLIFTSEQLQLTASEIEELSSVTPPFEPGTI